MASPNASSVDPQFRVFVARVRYGSLFGTKVVDDPSNSYTGRLAITQTLARLVAEEVVRKEHRILDVGCGTGTDLITLAHWGFEDLHGLDYNKADLRLARARERRQLGRRVVRWTTGTARDLARIEDRSFDVVLDTLLLSNFDERYHKPYFAEVARILRPNGLFLLHFRLGEGGPRIPRALFAQKERFRTGFAEGEKKLQDRPGHAMVYILRRLRE